MKRLHVLAGSLCLAICAMPSLAQTTSATLSGVVFDPTGKILPAVDILVLNEATGVQYVGKTNSDGIYSVQPLPAGTYRVQASRIGFKTLIKPDVTLNVQSALDLNFTLPIGASSESITVEGGASVLNTTDASVSMVVDRKFVENLPLNGRSFQDLIAMTPGVVTQSPQASLFPGYQGEFSVNGQRTESNYYTVDGIAANTGAGNGGGLSQAASTGAISAATALGTTQSLVSVDALQEFRVSSSTYSAEFGRSPGGQFSLMTRSGTNAFHGSLFDYFRNNALDANDWFNKHNGKAQAALRQNDFGGTVGGPIRIPHVYNGLDRSFFFVSYEGLRLAQPTAASTLYVPSLAVRANATPTMQSILNAYPLPTGPEIILANGALSGLSPFIAPYSLPSEINSTSARLDHHVGPKLSLFLRAALTPTSTQSRVLSGVTSTDFQSASYTLGATSQFSPRVSNEFRVGLARSASSFTIRLDGFGGASPIDLSVPFGIPNTFTNVQPYPYISITGVGTTSLYQGATSNSLHQWNVTDIISLTFGNHSIRTGIDQRYIVAPTFPVGVSAIANFTTRQSLTSGVTTSTQLLKRLSSSPATEEFSTFVQDEWKIRHNLVLSSGVRWDVNPPPAGSDGRDAYTLRGNINVPSTLTLAPQGTPLWKTAWFVLAPRLGFAWTANDRSGFETVVRAGGGVFFDTGTQIGTAGYTGLGYSASSTYTNAALPLTPSMFAFSTDPVAPYTGAVVYAFPEHLQPPYTLQWNVSGQQGLGKAQSLTVSYVAAAGRRLLQQQLHSVNTQNPNFGQILFFPGGVTSNYQSLQVNFQRSVTRGLQALASYTWSHALDFGSTSTSYPAIYGNSNFDVRNNLQAGLSWDFAAHRAMHVPGAFALSNWSVDFRLLARSAFPITLTGNALYDATGNLYYSGVNFDPSKPVYLRGPQYPGGRAVNGGPSATNPAFTLPTGANAGNAPRNFVRGFDAVQANAALRREFHPNDWLRVQFRAEAFNLLNHPVFGTINPTLTNALFGQTTAMLNQSLATMSALYQQGGARSMQFALRTIF